MNKELFQFLSELRLHNNREWFQANKPRYDLLHRQFIEVVQELINRMTLFEPELAGLTPKDCIFRIYRDIRFSPDKTPYKTHFGAYIAAYGGRKSEYAGYYLHLEPGASMLAGGVWCPPPALLKLFRKDIYENIEFLLNNVGLTKSKDQTDNQELTSIYNLNTDYISLSTAIAARHYAVNMVIDLKKLRNDHKNESSIYIYDPSGKLKDNKNEKFFVKSEKDYSILSNYKGDLGTSWYQACCSTLVIAENKEIIDKIDDIIKKDEISKDSNTNSESFETLQSLKLRELADYIGTSKYIKTLLSK